MATPEVAPMPQEGRPRSFQGEMRDLSKPAFRLELPDGTFITANSRKELMEKMKDVRDNVN